MDFQNEHLTRQSGLIPEHVLGKEITIIGAGAIGGWTALSLAKMGFGNLTVIDFDVISIENMNSQFYRMSDIDYPKSQMLSDMIFDFTNLRIKAVNDKFTSAKMRGIVICAVDNMGVRKQIWEAQKNHPFCGLVIDPRMGAETALMYAMNPNDPKDIASYEKTLYSDEDAVQERCTVKATIYTANLLAGMVVKTVKDYAVTEGKSYPRTLTWDISKDQFQCWRKESVTTD